MRVYELAKEVGISSKELLDKFKDQDFGLKNHMSSVDETVAELVREEYGRTEPETEPETEQDVAAIDDVPEEDREEERPAGHVERKPAPKPAAAQPEPPAKSAVIITRGAIVVKEFAEQLNLLPNQVIAELMGFNVLASINERIDFSVARKIAEKHGVRLEHEKKAPEHKTETARKLASEEEDEEDQAEYLDPRPPIVTFMGHVDHGKTSLLDKIRNTAVVDEEFGGITQHIGAYTIETGGHKITFLDTPGHEAFTAMRARGANLTDIAVIVVAADDGIMPQTREAIMHAKAANVALLFAINKTDVPGANIDRVKKQLQEMEMTPEDWGGQTICCPVSAATGDGIDHLLEMILLQAEMMDLKANARRRATGYVIEARLEPGTGPTVNLLVSRGTLSVGDVMVIGRFWGRVRALINDHGIKIKSVGPSTPVKCLGLSGVPEAGMPFRVYADERVARTRVQINEEESKARTDQVPEAATLESLYARMESRERKELKAILKTDTRGSAEAIEHALHDIRSEKISLSVILAGAGNITVSDVMLASASGAVILGFHVAMEPGVAAKAKHEGVDIRLHRVIYELVDEVRDALTGMLAPKTSEKVTGTAEIKQVFPVGKTGKAAGCLVLKGNVRPAYRVRVKRQDEILSETGILSLKRFQNSAAEVKETQEFGIRLKDFNGFNEGDMLEFYEIEQIKQTL